MKFRPLLSQGVVFGLFCAMFSSSAFAQPRDDYRQENRFLIVIETSSSLRKCTNAVDKAITELFGSDMKGELRPRDTIGVWTYNDKLHTEFPMQVWKETNSARIQRNVMTYLAEEKYEKRGHLDKVLPVIGKVIGESERLTVIFIFDGNDKIEGTPFDAELNELHKHFAREFKSKHEPFVTVLSARDGRFFDYTVSSSGSIKIPHTAMPWPRTNATPVVAAAPVPVAPPAPHKYTEIVMAGVPSHPAPITDVAPAETNQVPAAAPSNTVEPAPQAPLTNAVATNSISETTTNNVTNTVVAADSSPAPIVAAPATNAWTQPANSSTPPSTPIRTIPEDTALFVIAGSLLAIAAGLVWFLLKRTRAETVSLISQSMDRSS